ncbi:MAG: beta-ketoacyl-[acyl-carrier-protein] synthase II, partial [Actinobacteria bacterium]|nr:beta-ketoacyl-[acyl-carrier-protein] synthase II [Actinomycetota bacterium]
MITGIGPVTSSGIGIEALSAGLRVPRSPIARVTHFDPSPFRSTIAAEVTDFDPTRFMEPKRARRLDRFIHLTLAGTRLALDDAGLGADALVPDR